MNRLFRSDKASFLYFSTALSLNQLDSHFSIVLLQILTKICNFWLWLGQVAVLCSM